VVATPGIHRTASSRCRAVAADGRTPSEPNSTSRTIAGSGGAPTSPDVVIRQAGGSHQPGHVFGEDLVAAFRPGGVG
jgi:hypothetical protein